MLYEDYRKMMEEDAEYINIEIHEYMKHKKAYNSLIDAFKYDILKMENGIIYLKKIR